MGKKNKKKHHKHNSSISDESSPDERRQKLRHQSENSSESESGHSRSRSKSTKHKERPRSRSKDKMKKKKKRKSRSISPKLTREDIERLTEENKRQKERMKALETPEEKRARRLAKKETKEKKRKAEMGWDDEYMGYTNTDNPFGDEHLLDTFVWGKKMEKDGLKHVTKDMIERMQKHKMVENKIELEKVKKRRIEREHEREQREQEQEVMQRQKEAEYFREWEKQEDKFHLNQALMRSKIRIDDGRAKPIDMLAKYINTEDEDFSVEMHEPYTYLNGLTLTDLEDLREDIKVYMDLENGRNSDYWQDITIIMEDEIEKLRKLDPSSRNYVSTGRRSGINMSVADDVNDFFKGKNLSHLGILEGTIRKKLTGGEGVDVGYWESLLQQLQAHMARTRLRDRHEQNLRNKLFRLKQEQCIESAPLFPIEKPEGASSDAEVEPEPSSINQEVDEPQPGTSAATAVENPSHSPDQDKDDEDEEEDEEPKEEEAVVTEKDLADLAYTEYDGGNYSPRLVRAFDLEADAIVYDPEDDMMRLEYARIRVLQVGKAQENQEEELVKKAREGMTNDEAQFSVEVPLEKQNMLWSDKYRPRKPRFFNRVHTGFEWNKYNQTHYDIDNPPPKIVQGYKFNIFYPDLIDKSKTPEYILTPMDENKDFATLRFRAGPPYEDIAFKIVSREWEYSYKRGFRCQFHNNIFQLWFHFKRYRYRR